MPSTLPMAPSTIAARLATGDLTDATPAQVADLDSFLQTGAGAVIRSSNSRFRETVSVFDFMTANEQNDIIARTGLNTYETNIKNANDSMPDKGGIIYYPGGLYTTSLEVNVSKPILYLCEGWMDSSTSTSTSGFPLTQFLWGGSGGGYMFVFSAKNSTDLIAGTTDGKVLFNCGMVGASLNGNLDADFGIWAASTSYGKFDLHTVGFIDTSILVDGGNAALSLRNEFKVKYVHGASSATWGSHGVEFRRFNGSTTTQNRVVLLDGLVKNGDVLRLGDCDNHQIHHIHGSTISGGTGKAVRFFNDGAFAGSMCVLNYVVGDVHVESLAKGNRITEAISEAQSITFDPGGQCHYKVVDYVDGGVWETHKFKMSDKIFIPAHALRPDGTVATSQTTAGGLWSGIRFIDSATGGATGAIALPYGWNNGTITGFEVFFSMETANTSKNVRLQIRVESAADTNDITVADKNESFTVAVLDDANAMKKATVTFSTAIAYNFDEIILLNFQRVGGDGADDAAGNMMLFGVRPIFIGTGPDSVGSGPYDVGPVGE